MSIHMEYRLGLRREEALARPHESKLAFHFDPTRFFSPLSRVGFASSACRMYCRLIRIRI